MTATERRRDLLDEIAWLHSELHGAELESSKATSVLHAIDRLRRELSGYHGQLKAYDDLKAHCDNQRRRINELEGLYARLKEENAKLRELVRKLHDELVSCEEKEIICGGHKFDEDVRGLGIEV